MSASEQRRPAVAILSFSPIARDPRVLRQVKLFAQDFDVTTVGHGPQPDGVVRHVEIPIEILPWRTKRFVAPLLFWSRQYNRLYFGSDRIKFIQNAVPRGSVDVVVANDELAVPVALSLAPRGGVHVDLHEYSPGRGVKTIDWRLRVAPFFRWACRAARGADSVTTVAAGISAEYERNFGFTSQVVPNATNYRNDLVPTVPALPLRLVHIGIAGRARKLELMVDAVAEVESRTPGSVILDIILAPGDPVYITELEQLAAETAGAVRVLPPVPFEQMVSTLAAYDVGVFVCPPTTFNLQHALPNKFFEFVQARLGVIIGPSPEMAPFIEKYGFGLVAEGFDAAATAAAIAKLTPESVMEFKKASDAAAFELSAGELSKPWSEAVSALAARVQSTGTQSTGTQRTTS